MKILATLLLTALAVWAEKPNIILVYVDDMGYGDASCLNPKSKFKTPHLDRLAREGMTFTDGHCSDTVCTPSRYGLLTGRYAWRTTLKRGVMGAEGACLIADGRVTLASLLRGQGYATAMVGKWHLGDNAPHRPQDRGFQERVDHVHYQYQSTDLMEDGGDNASVIHLFNQFLLEALEMGATDIHIEPFEERVIVRYRIDGLLREIPTPPGLRELHAAVISRAKIMANLNIAEHRLPHDGRIRVNIGEEEFDLRVSILPSRFGETLNLRILSRQSVFYDLSALGLEPDQLTIMTKLLELPHGMVLVTGPTGSGKSTTLYAALDKTNKRERKVITVEDPVEYQLEGISQIQMHSEIGLTFASGLRSILRHDPDVILVGEIRDSETAEIAIRAALTGHLVLSTLHTNDSVGAVNRLVDMGIDPFLVASSLSASIAQRLVRRICPHCKKQDEDIPERIRMEIADAVVCADEDVEAWHGTGCVECGQTGYRGRVALYEFFLMNEYIEDMVTRRASSVDLRQAGAKQGMKNLRQDGWNKVMRGVTSISEINRITKSFDIHY